MKTSFLKFALMAGVCAASLITPAIADDMGGAFLKRPFFAAWPRDWRFA